jgi:ribosomal protein S18 acetylase RimI-like enzyme
MTEIRSFRAADEEAVVALWQACGLTRPWNDPYKDIRRKLTVQADAFLVAACGPDIVGSVMAGYDGHRGWVNYLAVAPSQRRSGLGRRLMDEAEARLLAYGCPKVNLQIRADNAAAIGFYEAIGYRVDEVVSMGKRLIED